ncbi:MAG TPA: RluA family pseudouridine synthase [Rectinemataceae bacterium]|nr:RluA family pseudouridine synthase [Rectinemataceae bacterium]
MNSGIRLPLGKNDEGRRLDKILRIALENMPLSAIHKALRKGDIRVNGARQSPEYRCREGDILEFSHVIQVPIDVIAQSLDSSRTENQDPPPTIPMTEVPIKKFPILLEAADLLFLDKPMGTLVHDGGDSLDVAVRAYLAGKLGASLAFTPGPLHRLDRNTSGIITFSKSLDGARLFSRELRAGAIRKTYVALLEGRVDSRQIWNDRMSRVSSLRKSFINPGDSGGFGALSAGDPGAALPGNRGKAPACASEDEAQEAITDILPLASSGDITLAALRLLTGRTHQIRTQSAFHGHPLLGDSKYGGRRSEEAYYLHAWELSFENQLFPDVPKELFAPLPSCFIKKTRSCLSVDEKEVYSLLRQSRF